MNGGCGVGDAGYELVMSEDGVMFVCDTHEERKGTE